VDYHQCTWDGFLKPWGLWGPPVLAALILAVCLGVSLPNPLFRDAYSTVILDRNGRVLAASLAPDGQWRFPASPMVPRKYAEALVSFEDKRFFRHFGVDFLALARALFTDVKDKNVVSGGSTLTMQVIRLAYDQQDRNLWNKFWESVLAFRLELTSTKAQILADYAAHAPFGGNIVGLQAASWRYFGRPPADLSWAEAALLAILPNSPSLLRPGRNQDLLRSKRNRLLKRLEQKGLFDEQTLRLSELEPLPKRILSFPKNTEQFAVFTQPAHQGETWVSTLDERLQRRVQEVQKSVQANLAANGINNTAVLVVDTRTGQVLAYSGNTPLPNVPGGANDMIQTSRSSGSTLKPFLYASMLDAGELTPLQLELDIPTRMGSFVPQNNTRTYMGAVPASEALERSLNIPATRELQQFGVSRFYDQLKALGFRTLFRPAADYGLPLIIGGAEVTLWDLTGAYAGLGRRAMGSQWPEGRSQAAFFPLISELKKPVLTSGFDPNEPQQISVGAAYLALDAMKELARPGQEDAWKNFTSSRRVAWKTGTSQGYRDAWAVGVTPEYTVGVWVGNASGEGRPDLLGFSVAAPLLFDVFNILGPTSWFSFPWEAFKTVELDGQSGYLAGPYSTEKITAQLPLLAPLPALDPYHKLLHLDRSLTHQVDSHSMPVSRIRNVPWFVLPPAVEYYYRPNHLEYRPPPPFLSGSASTEVDSPLALIFPVQGESLYIPVELDGIPGKTTLQATHRDPNATIFWHLDGVFLGSTVGIHQMDVRPSEGLHTLDLWDSEGHHLRRQFRVLSK
jgi:penicillin-binding protein 1C